SPSTLGDQREPGEPGACGSRCLVRVGSRGRTGRRIAIEGAGLPWVGTRPIFGSHSGCGRALWLVVSKASTAQRSGDRYGRGGLTILRLGRRVGKRGPGHVQGASFFVRVTAGGSWATRYPYWLFRLLSAQPGLLQ